MKKTVKWLSLLLAMLFCIGCITACGGDPAESKPTGDSTTTTTAGSNDTGDQNGDPDSSSEGDSTTTGAVTTTSTAGLTVKVTSGSTKASVVRTTGTTKANTTTKIPTTLDGETIVVSTWASSTIPTKDGTDSGNASYYAFEWAKKAYNVEVEWKVVPEETYFAEFTTAALSGESYSDICMTHSQTYLSWIMDELIVPLDDYMKKHSDKYWNKNTFVLNGKLYAMQRANSSGVSVPENIFLYNPKMIKQLGLEDPQKLALEGKWTWDKFREYCRAATDVSTGNYGVSAFNLDLMMYTNNIDKIVVENGKYLNGYTHGESAKNMLELLTLLQEMKVQDNSILGDVLGGLDPMNEALNAFLDGKVLFTFVQSLAWLKKQGYTDYAPVTFPIGPSNKGKTYNNVLAGFSCMSIPTNARYNYQDLVDFYCDVCTTWDKSRGDAYHESDIEEEIDAFYLKYYPKRSDAEFLWTMGKGVGTSIGWNVYVNNGGIEVYQIFMPILQNTSTPKNVLSATDGEIQTKINAVFGS